MPAFELEEAEELAQKLGVPVTFLDLDPLSVPGAVASAEPFGDDQVEGLAYRLLPAPAEQPVGRGVPVRDGPGGVRDHHRVGQLVHQAGKEGVVDLVGRSRRCIAPAQRPAPATTIGPAVRRRAIAWSTTERTIAVCEGSDTMSRTNTRSIFTSDSGSPDRNRSEVWP